MKGVRLFRYGRSPGTDELHLEVINRGNRQLVEVLYTIIKDAWENLEVPVNWEDAQSYHHQGKQTRLQLLLRDLALLYIREVLARILLKRLSTLAEDFLPKEPQT